MRQLLVVAGLLVRNGKVFLAQRHADDAEGGKWEFPGGKVEAGEDPRDALRRELMEELGVMVDVGPVLDTVSVVKREIHLILLYYCCQLTQGEPMALDCQAVHWFQPREADTLEKPEADRIFWERQHHAIEEMNQ